MKKRLDYTNAVIAFLVAVVAFIITIIVIPNLLNQEILESSQYYLFLALLEFIPISLGIGLYMFLGKKKLRDIFYSDKSKSKNILTEQIVLAIAIALFAYPIVITIQYVWTIILQGLGMQALETAFPIVDNPISLLYAFIGIAIVPAFVEELLFRGMLQPSLMSHKKPIVAICITSALFMLMHGSLHSMPFTFVLGGLMGYISYKSGSLWPSIAYHFTNNSIAVIVLYATSYIPEELLYTDTQVIQDQTLANIAIIQSIASLIIVSVICLIIVSLLVWAFIKTTKKSVQPPITPTKPFHKIIILISSILLLSLMGLTTLASLGYLI